MVVKAGSGAQLVEEVGRGPRGLQYVVEARRALLLAPRRGQRLHFLLPGCEVLVEAACGKEMKILAAITSPAQDDVIEKVLRARGEWLRRELASGEEPRGAGYQRSWSAPRAGAGGSRGARDLRPSLVVRSARAGPAGERMYVSQLRSCLDRPTSDERRIVDDLSRED